MKKGLYHPGRKAALAAAAVLGTILLIGLSLSERSAKVRYLTAPVGRGAITSAVEATGTINPLTTVPVGSYVSGTVKYIFADFNTRVRAGQVLAQIDPDVFEAQVATARGNLVSAQANLRKLEADRDYARASARRQTELNEQGLLSQDQRDLARSTLAQAEAAVGNGRAQVQAMDGALRQAEANRRYTTILSPMDGTVVARNIAVGQSVAASLQAPNLFTIAQDLKRMQVYAKTDESDTGFIKPGAEATFQVDAFPSETFHGRVSAIRLNATIVQNVVTYDTVIDFENVDERLLPGETAYVTIPTGHVEDTLTIPNAALTYTPELSPSEMEALLKKSGISAEAGSGHRGREQVVWRLTEGKDLEPVAVRVGISDYAQTQMAGGSLRVSDRLVTGAMTGGAASNRTAPGVPSRPPRR